MQACRRIVLVAACCVIGAVGTAATTTYEYDALGRLKKVVRDNDGVSVTYTFDAAGNRTSVVTHVPDQTAPSVPAGLTATPIAWGRIDLSWSPSTDNPGGAGVAGYRIYRNSVFLGTATSTSYIDTANLGNGATHSYRMAAFDAASPANVSAQSDPPVTATSLADQIAPTVPANLAASAVSPTQVNLSWSTSTDSGGSGLAGYKVYRAGTWIETVTTTSYSNSGLTPGATYSYAVSAYDNAARDSGPSAAVTVTTPVPLQATLNSTSWSWFFQQGSGTWISPNVVVTASGGAGGYTYAWQWVSGDTQTTVVSPTSNSTKWSRTVPSWFVDYTSVWRCRVTDSAGTAVYTPNVTVNFRKENLN